MTYNIISNNVDLYMYYEVPNQRISKTIDTDKNDTILSMASVLSYQNDQHKQKSFTDEISTVAEAYGRYRIKYNIPRDCYSEKLKETLIKACSGCEESGDLLYEYACAYLGLEIGDCLLSNDYDPEEDCIFAIEDDLSQH